MVSGDGHEFDFEGRAHDAAPQYTKSLTDIRVNAVDPGYTATDINGHQTITEGTDAIVSLATEEPGSGSGRLVDRFGENAWS